MSGQHIILLIKMTYNKVLFHIAKTLLVFLILSTGKVLFAQDSIPDYNYMYKGDSRIDTILTLNYQQNKRFPTIQGYRIQIFKGSGNNALNNALKVKNNFEKRYGLPAYITFNEPYYRVRVGDFRTHMQSIHFLEIIKWRYPLAWEIKDNISLGIKQMKSP